MTNSRWRAFADRIVRKIHSAYFKLWENKLDDLAQIRARHEEFGRLREAVCQSGTDNLPFSTTATPTKAACPCSRTPMSSQLSACI